MNFDPREIAVQNFEPYDKADFARLRETLALTDAESAALNTGLRRAAKNWEFQRLALGRLSAAETKEFGKLFSALATTISSLKNIDLDSWRRLESCYSYYEGHEDSANLSFLDDDWRADVFLTLKYDPSDPDRRCSYDLHELKTVLRDLSTIVEFGAVRWSEPRGPKPNRDLSLWLREIARVWEEDVGRRFTRQFHNGGEPISEAAVLSLYAYRVLDPSIRPSDIEREMKDVIRIRNGGEWRD
ncbi:hypothetical protein [Jannaschia sp. 2305UL9-9]|uniref:hypothetical protein n=1 Tax=Jannaschia sp. 2305UL9-9 TaxID=3121638 RepID=UPI003529BF17